MSLAEWRNDMEFMILLVLVVDAFLIYAIFSSDRPFF